MPEAEDYRKAAEEDARETVEEYLDEIVRQLVDDGEASKDLLNDYGHGDSYHHERHVDRDYTLLEAANLLDQLDEFEETDRGLWEGQLPRQAISAQAAYTYGNAVYSMFQDLIGKVNEEAQEVLEAYEERKRRLKEEIKALEDDKGTETDEERREDLEGRIELLEDRLDKLEAPDPRTKRDLQRVVYTAIGKKKKGRWGEGPKEWSP